jgi:hypothetical protein
MGLGSYQRVMHVHFMSALTAALDNNLIVNGEFTPELLMEQPELKSSVQSDFFGELQKRAEQTHHKHLESNVGHHDYLISALSNHVNDHLQNREQMNLNELLMGGHQLIENTKPL